MCAPHATELVAKIERYQIAGRLAPIVERIGSRGPWVVPTVEDIRDVAALLGDSHERAVELLRTVYTFQLAAPMAPILARLAGRTAGCDEAVEEITEIMAQTGVIA